MSTKQFYIHITGSVQGVGFRNFACQKASELKINGWIKNLGNENIELEISGQSPNIETFIDWIKIGPTRAVIRNFSITALTPQRDFVKFDIR